MKRAALNNLLEQAQKGDSVAREKLISYHKLFIAKISSRACKRYLAWENDDELSVALLAFNEAIDCYERNSKADFYTFARKVIKRKLIDFFRKESKNNISLLSGDPDEELVVIDKKSSFEEYERGRQEEYLTEVINNLNDTLAEYRITLADLAKATPKQRNTREALLNAAQKLAGNREMAEYLYRRKQLPLKALGKATGLSRRMLEKRRKYIIAIALMISCPGFSSLKNYVQFADESFSPASRGHVPGRQRFPPYLQAF